MANPSTSNSVNLQKIAVIAGGVALAASVGFAAYYAYKSSNSTPSKNEVKDPLALAELKKKEGNDLYRRKEYLGAIKLFKDAVAILKSAETIDKNSHSIIANCYNNISACYEMLADYDGCIKYCSDAIAIDSKYLKVLNRRARLYEKLGKYKEALDDFFSVTSLCTSEEQFRTLNVDVDRVLLSAITPELNEIFEKSEGTFKLIPQYTISHWLWSSVTNDPILKRLEQINLDDTVAEDSLNSALLVLKNNKYDEVLPLAIKAVKSRDSENNVSVLVEAGGDEGQHNIDIAFEKGAAILLSSRFLLLHNQVDKAREFIKQFDELQNEWDAEILDKLVDLRVAYYVLLITLAPNHTQAAEYIEKSLSIAPNNSDPLIAYALRYFDANEVDAALPAFERVVELDAEHPYAKYYIIYLNYVTALKQQAIDQVRTLNYKFDATLKQDSNPPVFAYILFTKLCMNSESGEIALETAKTVLKIMPKNAYALYLCGVLDCDSGLNLQDREKVKDYVATVEKVMNKVIKVDPNYWEPYRTLAKISLDKMNFDEALGFYEKAIPLTRTREELELLLKDKFLTELTARRVKDGHGIPFILPESSPSM